MFRSIFWAALAGLMWTTGFLFVAVLPEFFKSKGLNPDIGLFANFYHSFIEIGLFSALMAAVLIDLGIETLILPRSNGASGVSSEPLGAAEFGRNSCVGVCRFLLSIALIVVTVGVLVSTILLSWKPFMRELIGTQVLLAFIVKSLYYAKPPAQMGRVV